MSEIRTTQANPKPGCINFGIGQPGMDLLPLDIMRRAAEVRLGSGDGTLLSYGYELGDGYFRLALASFLQGHYGVPVSEETLMVSNGVSQALDLICTRFTKPGDTVFVEEPTYFLAPTIFADHQLQVVCLPTDENGLNVEALEVALQEYQPAFLYTIPVFQNPLGVTMPEERRKRVMALAEAHDFLVVADEVYQLLDYSRVPPLPFASYIENERVLSVSSFSKILGPGLRLGWIQAAPALLERLTLSGVVDSGGGLNPFTSNLVRIAIEEGWQEVYLSKLKRVYQERIERMDGALREVLPDGVTYTKPEGGFFFWLKLPEALDGLKLLSVAQDYQVGFMPGVRFSSRQGLNNYLRLSFAFYDEDRIGEGTGRLGKALDDFLT